MRCCFKRCLFLSTKTKVALHLRIEKAMLEAMAGNRQTDEADADHMLEQMDPLDCVDSWEGRRCDLSFAKGFALSVNTQPNPQCHGVSSQPNLEGAPNIEGEQLSYSPNSLQTTGLQTLNVVQWLPANREEQHRAIQLYSMAAGHTDSSHYTPAYLPSLEKAEEMRAAAPTPCTMKTTIVMAVFSLLFCGIFLGASAIVLVVKARSKVEQRQYTKAHHLIGYALGLITISAFVGIIFYVYLLIREFMG